MDIKYKTLINKLIQKTQSQKIVWEETSSANCYLTRISQNSITIKKDDASFDNNSNIILAIMDPIGRKIDQQIFSHEMSEYPLLRTLYDNARSSTVRVKQTLDNLINCLDFLY